MPHHGGNLAEVARQYGIAENELLDFSANVNPAGPPREVLDAIRELAARPERFARYPDTRSDPLRGAIARRQGVEPNCIVVGNGAAALIDAAVRSVAPRACVVPVPAFSEYTRALAAAGVAFVPFRLDATFTFDDAALLDCVERHGAELLVIVNPHNPSGTLIDRDRVVRLIAASSRRGITLLIDEAFIDYRSEQSVLQAATVSDRCVVIRSLTKFYGMPGIRIGYASASPAFAAAITARLPSWPVGTIEMAAALAAIGAVGYERETIRYNETARRSTIAALQALAIHVYPSAANFLLIELPCAGELVGGILEHLVRHHRVVVRDCRDYEGLRERSLLRIAIRGGDDDARLVEALRCALHTVR